MDDHWQTVERILIALFAAVPPTLMATAALIAALRAYRQAQRTFVHVDSRMNQLLDEAKNRARLEGVLEQQAMDLSVLSHPTPPLPPRRGAPDGPRAHIPPPDPPAGRSG